MKNISALMTSEFQDWETPKDLFNELDQEFNFTLDPCATKETAKCKKYYTKETDGLKQSWQGEIVFMNPPYGSEIKNWIKKAYDEWKMGGATVVCLIPARTDTKYFHDYIYHKAQLRFIKGRVKFGKHGDFKGGATFPSMIVIFQRRDD